MGKLLRLPLRAIPKNSSVPILQGPLRGRRWIVGAGNHGYWLGSYEYQKSRAFQRQVVPGSVVYDIGAHAGYYTLLASELVGDQGKVIAFEPLPRNLAYLKEHVRRNHRTNVQVVEAAVSDRSGSGFLELGPDPHRSMARISARGELEVQLVRLDDLVRSGTIPPPATAKIDVEGAELFVLRGAEETIREAHPVIFLATHGPEAHLACCAYLGSLDYRLESLIEGKDICEADELIALPATPSGR